MFKFLIVGFGNMGKIHLDSLLRSKNTELYGVVDHKINKKNEEVNYFKSIYDVNLNDDIDAVIISSTTSSHYEIAKEIIKFNLPVLIEKPISTDINEVKKIVDLFIKKKQILLTGFIELFNPVVSYLKSKEIKKISKIEITRFGPVQDKSRILDNVIYDLGIHDVSIFDFLFKLNKTEIINRKHIYKDNMIAESEIQFNSNNIEANLKLSNQSNEKQRIWKIYSDKFVYEADLLNRNLKIFHNEKIIEEIKFENYKDAIDLQLEDFVNKINKKSYNSEHVNSILSVHKVVDELN